MVKQKTVLRINQIQASVLFEFYDNLPTRVMCRNETAKPGFVAFTLERGNAIVVFDNVSMQVWQNCGDFYLSSEMTKSLMERASQTFEKGIEIINLKSAA